MPNWSLAAGVDTRAALPGAREVACALAFVCITAVAVDAHAQDAERGRQLYENHCQVCHTSQVHGRKNRVAFALGDLREIVRRWQENQGLRWTGEEIDDVTHFLATTKYHFSTSIESGRALAATRRNRD